MISAWELYLWTRLDMVSGLVDILLAVFVVGCIASIVIYALTWSTISVWCDDNDYDKRKRKEARSQQQAVLKALKYLVLIGVMCFMFALVPTKKQAAMIWVVPQLATTENADLLKGEAAEIYTLAKEALKESIGVKEKE